MRATLDVFVEEALPDLDPIVAYETTDYGWRGLTEQGEILEVKSSNGHKVSVPSSILVAHDGIPIGRRPVTNEWSLDFDDYLIHFNRTIELHKSGKNQEAFAEADAALNIAPTLRARFNRAMILLSLGRWLEGFEEYWHCEQLSPFMRPQVRRALDFGLRPWNGEDLRGKKILLLHAHGFGDTIMALRYVEDVKAMGAQVVLVVPRELQRLAAQHGCATSSDLQDADFFCPMLHLLRALYITPDLASASPYLATDPFWQQRTERRRIGIAWSIGKPSKDDYPREISLAEVVPHFPYDDLYSVQIQNGHEAKTFGVNTCHLEDFTDCAKLMATMDMVISVDTAALHLAGAIGHPKVYGLLSHWASWRWIATWYRNVTLLRQQSPGDWNSALKQIR